MFFASGSLYLCLSCLRRSCRLFVGLTAVNCLYVGAVMLTGFWYFKMFGVIEVLASV